MSFRKRTLRVGEQKIPSRPCMATCLSVEAHCRWKLAPLADAVTSGALQHNRARLSCVVSLHRLLRICLFAQAHLCARCMNSVLMPPRGRRANNILHACPNKGGTCKLHYFTLRLVIGKLLQHLDDRGFCFLAHVQASLVARLLYQLLLQAANISACCSCAGCSNCQPFPAWTNAPSQLYDPVVGLQIGAPRCACKMGKHLHCSWHRLEASPITPTLLVHESHDAVGTMLP